MSFWWLWKITVCVCFWWQYFFVQNSRSCNRFGSN